MSARGEWLLGERTSVDLDLPEASASDPAFVDVVGGPDKGRFYALPMGLTAVGRGTGNDFILTDPSASRHHLLLVRSESGLCARDLGSGNGTLRNGLPLVGDTALCDGDLLEIGDTRMAVTGGTVRALPVVRLPDVPPLSEPFETLFPLRRARTVPRPSQDLRRSLRRRTWQIATVVFVLVGLGVAFVRYTGKIPPSAQPVSTEALLPTP